MNLGALKADAKQKIRGKVGGAFAAWFIVAVISGGAGWALGLVPVVGAYLYTFLIAPAFGLGLSRMWLDISDDYTPGVTDAFRGFNDYFNAVLVNALFFLFTLLWSLLLLIPGIIKALSWSMAMYVLADNKGKSPMECLRESEKMTRGHKGKLFVFFLSWIGWLLLAVLTLGIGLIWIVPYLNTCLANIYKSLKAMSENAACTESASPTEKNFVEFPREE